MTVSDYNLNSMEEYFKTLSKEELMEIALNLYVDAERLRMELDEAQGVIR